MPNPATILQLREVHLLSPGGLLEFGGEHIIFGDKKGGTQNFFSPDRGEQKIFIKNF